jgi:hypothetical protein
VYHGLLWSVERREDSCLRVKECNVNHPAVRTGGKCTREASHPVGKSGEVIEGIRVHLCCTKTGLEFCIQQVVGGTLYKSFRIVVCGKLCSKASITCVL